MNRLEEARTVQRESAGNGHVRDVEGSANVDQGPWLRGAGAR
jgi:hypothetical protein